MTNYQDRANKFAEEYNKLVEKFGCQLVAIVEPEKLGEVFQVRPRLVIGEVPEWTEPPKEE